MAMMEKEARAQALGAIQCPKCHQSQYVRRSRRQGKDRVLSWIKLFPYRCQSCLHRFYRFGEKMTGKGKEAA